VVQAIVGLGSRQASGLVRLFQNQVIGLRLFFQMIGRRETAQARAQNHGANRGAWKWILSSHHITYIEK